MEEQKMQLVDWLDDLCVRFIINLPQEELESVERICFQIEEAQWFYEDFVRPLDPSLPSMQLRTFALAIFKRCPLTSAFDEATHMQAFDQFMAYKQRVPVRGAIMLNDAMDHAVLVRSWKKSGSWSFPRGKINKDETDLDCAVREAYEETGYDLKKSGLVLGAEQMKSIEISIREQHVKLFVFTGVPMDTAFAPRTRGEIGAIEWWKLSILPGYQKRKKGEDGKFEKVLGAAKVYNVAPFLYQLKAWIAEQRKRQKIGTVGTLTVQQPSGQANTQLHTMDEAAVNGAQTHQAAHVPEDPAFGLMRLLSVGQPGQAMPHDVPRSPPLLNQGSNNLLAMLQGHNTQQAPSASQEMATFSPQQQHHSHQSLVGGPQHYQPRQAQHQQFQQQPHEQQPQFRSQQYQPSQQYGQPQQYQQPQRYQQSQQYQQTQLYQQSQQHRQPLQNQYMQQQPPPQQYMQSSPQRPMQPLEGYDQDHHRRPSQPLAQIEYNNTSLISQRGSQYFQQQQLSTQRPQAQSSLLKLVNQSNSDSQGLSQSPQQLAPYHRIGDPEFARPQQALNQQGPLVPPASELPAPKLTSHAQNLLDVFKTGKASSNGATAILPQAARPPPAPPSAAVIPPASQAQDTQPPVRQPASYAQAASMAQSYDSRSRQALTQPMPNSSEAVRKAPAAPQPLHSQVASVPSSNDNHSSQALGQTMPRVSGAQHLVLGPSQPSLDGVKSPPAVKSTPQQNALLGLFNQQTPTPQQPPTQMPSAPKPNAKPNPLMDLFRKPSGPTQAAAGTPGTEQKTVVADLLSQPAVSAKPKSPDDDRTAGSYDALGKPMITSSKPSLVPDGVVPRRASPPKTPKPQALTLAAADVTVSPNQNPMKKQIFDHKDGKMKEHVSSPRILQRPDVPEPITEKAATTPATPQRQGRQNNAGGTAKRQGQRNKSQDQQAKVQPPTVPQYNSVKILKRPDTPKESSKEPALAAPVVRSERSPARPTPKTSPVVAKVGALSIAAEPKKPFSPQILRRPQQPPTPSAEPKVALDQSTPKTEPASQSGAPVTADTTKPPRTEQDLLSLLARPSPPATDTTKAIEPAQSKTSDVADESSQVDAQPVVESAASPVKGEALQALTGKNEEPTVSTPEPAVQDKKPDLLSLFRKPMDSKSVSGTPQVPTPAPEQDATGVTSPRPAETATSAANIHTSSLLSLFSKPTAPASATKAPSAPAPGSQAPSERAPTPTIRSRLNSVASGSFTGADSRRGSQTPISPSDRGFLLNFLDGFAKGSATKK